jgi:hypothetical protein
VDAGEQLKEAAVGLLGGLDHLVDNFGAEGFAVVRRDPGKEWHQAGLSGVRTGPLHHRRLPGRMGGGRHRGAVHDGSRAASASGACARICESELT